MALVVKFKVEADRDYLNIFDTTGVYSSTNQGGWGLPNTLLSAITSANVHVYFPGQTVPQSKSVSPVLPNTDNIGFQLEPSMFGQEKFAPGIYRIDLIYTTSTATISTSVTFYHYRPLECCITNKKGKLSPMDATSEKAMEVLELEALLENSIWASCSGDIHTASEIAEYIEAKCKCCGC